MRAAHEDLPAVTDAQIEALADLVAERLEQRHRRTTASQHWTDHLAATLDRIRARQIASGEFDAIDHPEHRREPRAPGVAEQPAADSANPR